MSARTNTSAPAEVQAEFAAWLEEYIAQYEEATAKFFGRRRGREYAWAAKTEVREHQRNPNRLRDYAEIDEGLKEIDEQSLAEMEAALIPQRDAMLEYIRRAWETSAQSPEWVNAIEFDPGVDFSIAVDKMFKRSWFFARDHIWEREYWDEEKHPRHPAGTSEGGEFAPGSGETSPANKPGHWQQMTPEEQRAWRDMDNKRQKEQRAARKAKKAGEPPKVEEKKPVVEEKKSEPAEAKQIAGGPAYVEFSKLPPNERTEKAAYELLKKHEGKARLYKAGEIGPGAGKAEVLTAARLGNDVVLRYPPTDGGRLTAARIMEDYHKIPRELHVGTSSITVLEQTCALNKEFGKKYGMAEFKSWATASWGGAIKIYDAHQTHGAPRHEFGLNHEMAHNVAERLYSNHYPAYDSPLGKLWDKYSAPGIKSVTEYSKASAAEFFAESMAYMTRSKFERTVYPDIAAAVDLTMADIRTRFKL